MLGKKTGSTIEQLRSDIDHGRTGDKVEASDPAAAPLGTDEEAAGTPLPGTVIDATRQEEIRRGRNAPRKTQGLGAAWLLIGFIIVFTTGIVSWMFVR